MTAAAQEVAEKARIILLPSPHTASACIASWVRALTAAAQEVAEKARIMDMVNSLEVRRRTTGSRKFVCIDLSILTLYIYTYIISISTY